MVENVGRIILDAFLKNEPIQNPVRLKGSASARLFMRLTLVVYYNLSLKKNSIMKKNKYLLLTLTIILAMSFVPWQTSAYPTFSDSVDLEIAPQEVMAQQPMRSRQIIENGTMVEVTGLLKKMGGGWFIAVDQALHQLYTAPSDFKEQRNISLKEGEQVVITGFYHAEEGEVTGIIAVCTITTNGKEIRFREDDGSPMWRGRGSGGSPR